MSKLLIRYGAVCAGFAALSLSAAAAGKTSKADFGRFVADQLSAHSLQLFGFRDPLATSASGPFDGPSEQALELAGGLHATLVSSAVHFSTDQIALWPNDDAPTHLFVCDEEGSNPSVQRVDLSRPAGSNATTIVTGLSSCDPVRRTPWGTIIVAEEAGASGGFYELIDPEHINTAINVTNRTTGANTDALHLAKRQAVGSLSFESFAIRPDGTMIYGDELAPSGGVAGGGIYKFVPDVPFASGGTPITTPGASPFVSGKVYGLRVAASGSTNWGQGAETGKGLWVLVDLAGQGVMDASGNIILRTAQTLQRFTGYYRPEDMDIDPIAREQGVFRACWANTGRMSHGGGSLLENSAVYSEVMCLTEESVATAPIPATGTVPTVERFIAGDREANMYDNVAFQPITGNLVVLEDGSTNVVTDVQPTTTKQRGNDMWICLPDGEDKDTESDGCVRFASLRDTSSEPTGFIFLGSGEEAFVSLQHRATDERNNRGSLLKISGFKVN